MTRQPDPARKPALLEQILDYLLDKPLSSVSLRPLAKALGVSTFTLAYHFGSRAELVSEIVQAVSSRTTDIGQTLTPGAVTVDAYIETFEITWAWAVQPRNILLQRLDFEAAMLEAHEPELHMHSRDLFAKWQSFGRTSLIELGFSEDEAEAESRVTVNTLNGFLFDLVVNSDAERSTAAFRHFVEMTRERLERRTTNG